MDEKMDNGPILAQMACGIMENETYATLEEKLAKLSGEMLIATIPDFTAGKITPRGQDETQATFTKKFKTEDGFIEYAEIETAQRGGSEKNALAATAKAIAILRKINALNPEPGAWTMRNGKRLKLLEAEIKDGVLHLITIQEEGQTPRRIE
jgi:methionyl-tRNA formyltransferase